MTRKRKNGSTGARYARIVKLAAQIQRWQTLAAQRQYPQSLHDILEAALVRDYQLGKKAAR